MNFKNNKGLTGVDIAISSAIFMIFVSLIVALFYNSSITSTKVERKSVATNKAIEIIEALKVTEFTYLIPTDETPMTLENLNIYTSKEINIPNGYNLEISIKNPEKDGIEDESMGEIMKIVTVDVSYSIGKNTENVTITTLIRNT